MSIKMSYDVKCHELAVWFLPKDRPNAAKELAQEIQDVIENYLTGLVHNHTCQQCEKLITADCECDKPGRMGWCSSNCRAAFDL